MRNVSRLVASSLAASVAIWAFSASAATASPRALASTTTSGALSPAAKAHARPGCKARSKRAPGGALQCLVRFKDAFSTPNWSGYTVSSSQVGFPITSVTGTWTVPSTSGSGDSSAWVGVDGLGNGFLLQAGTEQHPGTTVAWWQILPQENTQNNVFNVNVGDTMYVSITKECNSASSWEVTIIDQTDNQTFSTAVAYSGPESTAEWVMEAPQSENILGQSQDQLVDYSQFSFDNATVNGSSPHLTNNDSMTMVQNGKIVSTPSGPDQEGDGFSMVYGSAFALPPPNMLGYTGFPETFQPLSATDIYVLGTDRHLWLETQPWNSYPPVRSSIDECVRSFQALSTTQALVLGLDGNLWLESAPWNTSPPHRSQVDGNVEAFQALNDNTIFVLGTNGLLWEETAPYGPSHRVQVDGNVASFQPVGLNQVVVLGTNGNLWLETGPYGPSHRVPVDGNVDAFQATNIQYAGAPPSNIYVLGTNGNLWQELGAFGPAHRNQVDSSVRRFQVLDSEHDNRYPNEVYVVHTYGELYAEPNNYNNSSPLEIDANVATAVPADLYDMVTLGSNRVLWLEYTPFGTVPPRRDRIDANVAF